jgi:hypothetical protein
MGSQRYQGKLDGRPERPGKNAAGAKSVGADGVELASDACPPEPVVSGNLLGGAANPRRSCMPSPKNMDAGATDPEAPAAPARLQMSACTDRPWTVYERDCQTK